MQRRDALKRLAMASLTAATAPAWATTLSDIAHAHAASAPLQAGVTWEPKVFTPHQNETVVTLTELIIPQTDTAGKCKSVYYVDRISRHHREVFGKLVILCASTLESTRIMLNSRSDKYPNGIANSSEALGHYLMDHVTGGRASGTLPVLKGVPDTRGNRPNGVYMIRYRNIDSKHPDFIRGYGYQGSAQEVKWGHATDIPGFGADFKKAVKETRP